MYNKPSNPSDVYIVPEDIENEVKNELRVFLKSRNQWNVEKNVEELLTIGGGFIDRLNFLMPKLNSKNKLRLLVSGCSVGSELIIARNHGFQSVIGTEVIPEYVDISRRRTAHIPQIDCFYYDGYRLPFKDREFTCVASGHIIEHTPSPFRYFREHLRVLAEGGVFFVEFPDRYHSIELHTGTRSFEFLPWPFRNIALRYMASPLSRTSLDEKERYRAVLNTLRPISVWQIRGFLLLSGRLSSKIISVQRPAPGFVRVLVQK